MRGSSPVSSRRGARPGAARRPGRRPRGVVGERATTPRRTRRSRRSSPPSSRRPASRSSSSFYRAGGASGQDRGGARGGPAARLRLRPDRCPITSRRWAFDDRLVDLIGRRRPLLGPVRSGRARPGDAAQRENRAERPSTGCRWAARPTISMSGRASWSARASPSRDIPKEWEAFWSFWCDRVQPAVRQAIGRDDIWGIGLPMSVEAVDTRRSSSSSWPPTRRTT